MVSRTAPGDAASHVALPPIQASGATVVVPDAQLLFSAEFSRVGDDLLLTGPDGTTLLIQGYYALDAAPMLLSSAGALMTPELVAILVGPRAAGQYAQAAQPPGEEPIGQVESLTGTAQAIRGGAPVQLAVGDPVFQGDVVQTGAGSELGLGFADGTAFTMTAGGRMVLNSLVYDPNGSANSMLLTVIQGTFAFVTGQIAPTGDFHVTTPVVTIGVRGTASACDVAAVAGLTRCSAAQNPDNSIDPLFFFDVITNQLIATTTDPNTYIQVSSAGGPPQQIPKTPAEIARDQGLVQNAHRTYNATQQRLERERQEEQQQQQPGDDQRGEVGEGEFGQAIQQGAAGESGEPAAEPDGEAVAEAGPPLETGLGPLTSGGIGGFDEPEFGSDRLTPTAISSADTQNSRVPTSAGSGSPPPPTFLPTAGPLTEQAPAQSNVPPVAAADSASTEPDVAITIPVLGNDSDPEGGPLTVVTVSQGANGAVTINPDGTLTYTPNAGFAGNDAFTYTVSDGLGGTTTATVNVRVAAVNDPPAAVADTATTDEDAPVVIPVLGNDSDPDGDALTVSAVTQGANGSVAINPDGTVTYTPNAGFAGGDSFTYTVADGLGGTTTATVTVTVNAPPVAAADSASTEPDAAVTIPVLGNDSDPEGGPLAVIAVTQGANGTVAINPDGTLTYTPNAGFAGGDSFTYTVADGLGGTTTATVTVTVNAPPVAAADSASTEPDTSVTIPVLGNDSDPEGSPLAVIAVTQGTNGTVVINPNGTVTYTPNAGFSGGDSFTYTASDGQGGTATATVTVTVNAPPVAAADSASTEPDTSVTIPVLGNDSDPDGNALTVSAVTQGANGTVAINPNGTVTYTPNANFSGADSFEYTVSDGLGGLAIGTVNVTVSPVNDAPVVNLNGADGATFTEGGASVFVDDDLLVSDLDSATLSGATVTIENIANPGAEILSANTAGTAITASFDAGAGVLTLSGNAPPATYQQVLRTVTYQNQSDHPTSGGNAQRSIRFVVNDGIAASAAAIGLVAVAPVNDAPVNDMPGAQTKPSAAPLVFSADNNNSISIADLDVGGATLRVTLSVSDGTLSLGQTTGLAFSVGDGTADATMTFTGTLANVNAALNGLAYDAAGFAGEATLTITTSDLGNTGAPGALAASDTVTIRVEGDVVIGDQTLIVGDSGPANFVIDGGETLTVAGAVVGNQAAGDGTLTVSGPASALNVASAPEVGDGSLTVGLLGTGTVEVLNGGLVSAENATLGLETGSSGTLNLAGGSSFNLVATSALLLVGKNGEGTLLVEGSSQVAIDGLAGVFPGIEIAGDAAEDTGTGSVTVTGEGSQITFAGDTPFLQVGRSGIGNLNVLNGGFVGNATFLSIGRLAGGFGTVNLSGPQSTILLTGIASAAAAAEFPVVSAGDGPFLNVGALGTGILNITGGATFRIETDEILAVNGDAGFNVGGSSAFPGGNGALLVDGMNTQLLVDANETFFGVGSNDGTGAMTVSGGGQVVLTGSAFAVIGRGGDGLLTVDGNGSLLQLGEPGAVDAGLRVGDAGGSGTFIVSGGAHFNTFFLEIGRNGGTGAATFTDPGTTVVLSEQFGNFAAPFQNEGGFLRVARDAGDVGFLNVLNQAVVELTAGTGFSAPGLEIARNPGSSGTVLVDNATINISQAGAADPFLGGPFLQVGRAGAGTMTIRNGGEVRLTGDQAFVQVSRGNANEFADPATAPILAPSALEILSGGKLLVDGIAGPAGLIIGQEANGNGNVLVSGVGSLFSVAPSDHSQLFIGLRGDGTLAITDGGLVTGAELVFVGLDPGSMGSLIVSGPDSRLVATDVEVVQGTLEVMAGGAISGIFLAAGRVAGSDGTMILDGPDSIVELSGVLGDAAFLNVGRGGTGHLEVTKGAKILIDGQDGIQPGFQVGRDTGSNGTMVVSGPGSEVAISSLLTDFNAGYIAIGRSGIGDLQILDGGTVSNAPTGVTLIGGDITEDTGGTPGTGTVLVQGTAPGEVTPARISTLNAGAWLLVGEDFNFFTGEPAGEGTGGTGTLTIGEFGTVVAGTVVIGTGGTVQGTGDLGARSENASFEFGSIEVHGGTLAPGFSAGTLHLDGNVTFAAGRLEIELGGAGAGLSDLIEVAGEAELLGGLIDVALIDGYLPQAGQSVVFLSAGQGLNADLDDLAVAVHGVARDFDFMLERDGNEIAFTALNDARAGNGSIFLGGNADDVFLGGAGDDLLVGGGGADRLTGGAGADIFVLGAGDGGATLDLADLLTDFEDGLDLIGLEGGLSFADLTISGAATGGSAVSLTASGEILALVQGVSQDLLDSNDFTTAV